MVNDLNAPRFNPRKFRYSVISKELWLRWKKETGLKKIPYQDFAYIWNLIGNKITQKVVDERDGIKLSHNIGEIYAGYTISKKTRVSSNDPIISQEIGKPFKYENWHSNNKYIKIIFGTAKRKYIYENRNLWGFIPHRDFARSIAAQAKETPERYKLTQEKRYNVTDLTSDPEIIKKILKKRRK